MRKLSDFVKTDEDYEPWELDLEDGGNPVLFRHSQFTWAAEDAEDLQDNNRFSAAVKQYIGDDDEFKRAWSVLGKLPGEQVGKLLNEVKDHFREQHESRTS
ncbi:hypothetical protein ACWEOE_10905 [Amycolatopsis sp. NPDC004368]